MEIAALIMIMLGLSASCFSVALNSGIYRCIECGETFRMALMFAFSHAVMLGTGWLIGHVLNGWLQDMSFPVAILILFFIGGRLLLESRRRNPQHRIILAEDLKWMVMFTFLVSINTFLTGISLGILTDKIWASIAILSGIAFLAIILGVNLGKRAAPGLGQLAETAGGILLMAVSAIILLQYLKIV